MRRFAAFGMSATLLLAAGVIRVGGDTSRGTDWQRDTLGVQAVRKYSVNLEQAGPTPTFSLGQHMARRLAAADACCSDSIQSPGCANLRLAMTVWMKTEAAEYFWKQMYKDKAPSDIYFVLETTCYDFYSLYEAAVVFKSGLDGGYWLASYATSNDSAGHGLTRDWTKPARIEYLILVESEVGRLLAEVDSIYHPLELDCVLQGATERNRGTCGFLQVSYNRDNWLVAFSGGPLSDAWERMYFYPEFDKVALLSRCLDTILADRVSGPTEAVRPKRPPDWDILMKPTRERHNWPWLPGMKW